MPQEAREWGWLIVAMQVFERAPSLRHAAAILWPPRQHASNTPMGLFADRAVVRGRSPIARSCQTFFHEVNAVPTTGQLVRPSCRPLAVDRVKIRLHPRIIVPSPYHCPFKLSSLTLLPASQNPEGAYTGSQGRPAPARLRGRGMPLGGIGIPVNLKRSQWTE